MKKRRIQSLHFSYNVDHTMTEIDHQRWLKSKKINGGGEKLQLLGYSNISKSRFYLLSLFQEKHDYFLQYFPYFCQKTD